MALDNKRNSDRGNHCRDGHEILGKTGIAHTEDTDQFYSAHHSKGKLSFSDNAAAREGKNFGTGDELHSLSGKETGEGILQIMAPVIDGCLHCNSESADIQVECDECDAYICETCHWCHEFQADHEIRVCGRCDAFYCRNCDEMDQCDDCGEVVCSSCSTLLSCKFCGGKLCEICAKACGRCGIVLCSRDAKFAVDCDTCRMSYCLVCLASGNKDPCVRCNHRPSKRMEQLVHLRLKSIYKAFKHSSQITANEPSTSTKETCQYIASLASTAIDSKDEDVGSKALLQAATSAAARSVDKAHPSQSSAPSAPNKQRTSDAAKQIVDKYLAEKKKADEAAQALIAEIDEEEEAVKSKKSKKKRKKERQQARKDRLEHKKYESLDSELKAAEAAAKLIAEIEEEERTLAAKKSEKTKGKRGARRSNSNGSKKAGSNGAAIATSLTPSSSEDTNETSRSQASADGDGEITTSDEDILRDDELLRSNSADSVVGKLDEYIKNEDVEGIEEMIGLLRGVPGRAVARKNAKKALKRLKSAQEAEKRARVLEAKKQATDDGWTTQSSTKYDHGSVRNKKHQSKGNDYAEKVMTCDRRYVPLLIGRRGWTVKYIQDSSGARVDIDQSVLPRQIKISGQPSCVEIASRYVQGVLDYPRSNTPNSNVIEVSISKAIAETEHKLSLESDNRTSAVKRSSDSSIGARLGVQASDKGTGKLVEGAKRGTLSGALSTTNILKSEATVPGASASTTSTTTSNGTGNTRATMDGSQTRQKILPPPTKSAWATSVKASLAHPVKTHHPVWAAPSTLPQDSFHKARENENVSKPAQLASQHQETKPSTGPSQPSSPSQLASSPACAIPITSAKKAFQTSTTSIVGPPGSNLLAATQPTRAGQDAISTEIDGISGEHIVVPKPEAVFSPIHTQRSSFATDPLDMYPYYNQTFSMNEAPGANMFVLDASRAVPNHLHVYQHQFPQDAHRNPQKLQHQHRIPHGPPSRQPLVLHQQRNGAGLTSIAADFPSQIAVHSSYSTASTTSNPSSILEVNSTISDQSPAVPASMWPVGQSTSNPQPTESSLLDSVASNRHQNHGIEPCERHLPMLPLDLCSDAGLSIQPGEVPGLAPTFAADSPKVDDAKIIDDLFGGCLTSDGTSKATDELGIWGQGFNRAFTGKLYEFDSASDSDSHSIPNDDFLSESFLTDLTSLVGPLHQNLQHPSSSRFEWGSS